MDVFIWFLAIIFFSWVFLTFVLPLLGRMFLRKISRNFEAQAKQQQSKNEPEGTVHIDNKPSAPSINSEIGDYVNFEEIKENK